MLCASSERILSRCVGLAAGLATPERGDHHGVDEGLVRSGNSRRKRACPLGLGARSPRAREELASSNGRTRQNKRRGSPGSSPLLGLRTSPGRTSAAATPGPSTSSEPTAADSSTAYAVRSRLRRVRRVLSPRVGVSVSHRYADAGEPDPAVDSVQCLGSLAEAVDEPESGRPRGKGERTPRKRASEFLRLMPLFWAARASLHPPAPWRSCRAYLRRPS